MTNVENENNKDYENGGQAQEITITHLYEELIKTKIELKSAIEAGEARVVLETELLKNKIKHLEKENQNLRNKVEQFDRNNRKNNILIFGLERQSKEVPVESIKSELKNLLDIDLKENDISNVYYLGNQERSPIKLELVSFLKKSAILKNCGKLKGTKISIINDLTEFQREEYKSLRQHMHRLKNPSNQCFIKANKLYINNKPYSIEELEEKYNAEKEKPKSLPATPSREVVKKIHKEGKDTTLNIEPATANTGHSTTGQGKTGGESSSKTRAKTVHQPMKEKVRLRSMK